MKSKRKILLFDISFFIAMFIAVCVYAVADFQSGCENIKDSVLRLHVIANSDSVFDQNLKLKVRDAVIESGALMFSDCSDNETAAKLAEEQKAYLKETAEEVIEAAEKDYDVSLEIGEEYYPTRTYENATLPAGKYLSLRVIIGEGAGHNWWCVMFPPMCVSAATKEETLDTVLNEDGLQVVNSDPKYEVRFKLVEWYEGIKAKLASNL